MSYKQSPAFLKQRAPTVNFVEAMGDQQSAAMAEADVVIYLAHRARPGSNMGRPHLEIQGPITDFARFCTELVELNPKSHLIFPSSGGQIYGTGYHEPPTEEQPTNPVTPYGLGKKLSEELLAYLYRAHGLNSTILRLANPVGKWQLSGTHGLVTAAVRAAHNKDPITIFGTGTNVRDYFDAVDLASFLVDLSQLQQIPRGTYNIGSGSAFTELDTLRMVEEVLQQNLEIRYQKARSFDVPYATVDISKARRELHWRPETTLPVSIKRIYEGLSDPLILE